MLDDCDLDLDCYEGPYLCANKLGVAECSAFDTGTVEQQGTVCTAASGPGECDGAGTCVGKKIFIAFKNLNIYKLVTTMSNNNLGKLWSKTKIAFCCSIGRTDT